jgi:4-diphosphocytidyl-2-C-methyl-D-erythritol kinase
VAPGPAVRSRGKGDQADRGQARTRPRRAAHAGARRLSPTEAFAPAKVNLYLHVVGRRGDGYHLLDSLVAFADIGDRVGAAPAAALTLAVTGPEAAALAGLDDNLVLRAARLLAPGRGAALTLDKHLPVAAGIGGGSSDAAAALRALAGLWRVPLDGLDTLPLGADVPACLAARPLWVGGVGEILEPAADLPPTAVVLANPRRALPTAAVFRARSGPFGAAGRFAMPRDAAGLAAALRQCRNDLTEAAIALVPEIAAVLDALAALPGALLARMSGSGATCFALFAALDEAEAAAQRLAGERPGWWVKAGRLSPPA